MNDEILIELGEVSEVTQGTGNTDPEGEFPNKLRIT